MLPLYRDPEFAFRFDSDRRIVRIHLEGVSAGSQVSLYRIDPATKKRLGLLATAVVGADGWVELQAPIIVRAGDAFVAAAD